MYIYIRQATIYHYPFVRHICGVTDNLCEEDSKLLMSDYPHGCFIFVVEVESHEDLVPPITDEVTPESIMSYVNQSGLSYQILSQEVISSIIKFTREKWIMDWNNGMSMID